MSLKDWLQKRESAKAVTPTVETSAKTEDKTTQEEIKVEPIFEGPALTPEPEAAAEIPAAESVEPSRPIPAKEEIFKEVEQRIIRAKEPVISPEPQPESVGTAIVEEPAQEAKTQTRERKERRENVFTRYWWVFAGAAALLVGWGLWKYLRSRRGEDGGSRGPWGGPQAAAPRAPYLQPEPPPTEPRKEKPSPPADQPPPPLRPSTAADKIVDDLLSDDKFREAARRIERKRGN